MTCFYCLLVDWRTGRYALHASPQNVGYIIPCCCFGFLDDERRPWPILDEVGVSIKHFGQREATMLFSGETLSISWLVSVLLLCFSNLELSAGFLSRGGVVSSSQTGNIINPILPLPRKDTATTVIMNAEQPQTSTTSGSSRPVDSELLEHILTVAIDASKKAGDIILGNAGGAEVTNRKANSRDLLTLIDPLCEKTIREIVLKNFPDHDFLGEEDVPPGKEAAAGAIDAKIKAGSDWLWIVDPIDGTTNFVSGMPLCMPSIAAAYKGEVVVGVIYDPHRDELFTAKAGCGAEMNAKAISVGKQDKIGDAVIGKFPFFLGYGIIYGSSRSNALSNPIYLCDIFVDESTIYAPVAMGSPPGEESMQMSLKGVQALMPKVRTIRMLGSAALMLAWVGNGRLTCYWEYDLSSWDIAAGALIVKEAGGKFTHLDGKDFTLRTRKICASNGKVHDKILSTLKDAGVV